ncbi:MAG: Eco57I restriction-modification methylase domain-containing protein [bacterium]
MNTKKQFGQFFTTNSDYILQGLVRYIKNKKATDPFAGGGDLIKWAKVSGVKDIKGYDVDEAYVDNKNIFYNDSLNNPLKMDFVITNPPYLNINKADLNIKAKYFNNFDFEDLYQISLYSIMNSNEGIVIVPVNFLSAQNSKKIRNIFFSKFKIVEMNYFKEQVFPDTTYNVIAFYYKKKKNMFDDNFVIKTHVYPDNKIVNIELRRQFDWTIGGDLYKAIGSVDNDLGIRRLTEADLNDMRGDIKLDVAYNHIKTRISIKVNNQACNLIRSNIILLKAIDSGSKDGIIALENIKDYGVECLISKNTSRHMIYLLFKEPVSIKDQKKIIDLFNQEINKLREEYLSLFLTNYRDNDRKRISFYFVYKFINFLYFNKIKNNCGNQKLFFPIT